MARRPTPIPLAITPTTGPEPSCTNGNVRPMAIESASNSTETGEKRPPKNEDSAMWRAETRIFTLRNRDVCLYAALARGLRGHYTEKFEMKTALTLAAVASLGLLAACGEKAAETTATTTTTETTAPADAMATTEAAPATTAPAADAAAAPAADAAAATTAATAAGAAAVTDAAAAGADKAADAVKAGADKAADAVKDAVKK